MGRLVRFVKGHTLWVGFVAAVIPLGVLLWLQYGWLCRLEQASAIAHHASLRNYLDAVATEIEFFYRSTAERALNVPSTPLVEGNLEPVAAHWKKKFPEGARRLYLVDYTKTPTGNFYAYDPDEHILVPTPASDESLAVVIACLPWQARVRESAKAESVGLQVNEQEPKHRIILSPVTDEQMNVVGIVAMIADESYFRDVLLPATIRKSLPAFFPGEAGRYLEVSVRDHRQDAALGEPATAGEQAVERRFPFIFTDWTLVLRSTGSTPEQWARGSFTFNMTLAILLALVLLGGIALALRVANRAVRLSEMKADFVSNVSHELRTPLASIRVFAEHLREGRASEPGKVKEYGEYIEAESHRLSRLIENILDFSRIESARKRYHFVATDLAGLVAAVTKSFQVRLAKSGFQVELDLPGETLPAMQVDPDAIGQALHNLLDNAAKYSQERKHVEVRLHAEDGHQVITVRDRGIGIAREELGRIFERFHRVGSSLVHNVKGNGLGLSIVEHVVRAHGGTVTVESEPGKGSAFFVRLPTAGPGEGRSPA